MNAPYATISKGGAGFYALIVEWNPEGFWEPYTTGDGRYATEVEAIEEAVGMADCEGVDFYGSGIDRSEVIDNTNVRWRDVGQT